MALSTFANQNHRPSLDDGVVGGGVGGGGLCGGGFHCNRFSLKPSEAIRKLRMVLVRFGFLHNRIARWSALRLEFGRYLGWHIFGVVVRFE